MARGRVEKRGSKKRKVKPVILIVTEGSKTEPGYFNHFRTRQKNIDVRVVGSRTSAGETDYEKTDDVFPMLEGHLDKATKRASQLEEYHLKNGNAVPYGIAVNPFTEVYRLIEAIIS